MNITAEAVTDPYTSVHCLTTREEQIVTLQSTLFREVQNFTHFI